MILKLLQVELNNMKRISEVFPIILFLILSFIIVFPLLLPGYIITLDMVFTPKLQIPSFTSPSFFFSGVLWLLNLVIPSYFLQKAMLFMVFFLAGWGMYRFVSKKFGWFGILGGIFFAINPFVYERVMAGQWQFLLGYSILPFVIPAIIDFFDDPNRKNAVILGLWAFLLINLAIHFSLILFIILLVYGFAHAYFNKEKIYVGVKYLFLIGSIVILLNSNWLLPTILGKSSISQTINLFDSSDLTAFQSVPDNNFGLIFNLLSGFGFWMEAYDYFILPKNIIFFWPLISLIIIGISLWGLVKSFQKKERTSYPLLITLAVIFLLSLDLAGGVAIKSSANFFYFLYTRFPILRGFREPQKLVGIMMFCYAYFGSIGIVYLSAKVRKSFMFYVLCFMFLFLPFIYTPTIFGGFWGQLKPVFYPDSWKKVNRILNEDRQNFLTLFFPWHQYIRFMFANNRVIASPAPYFFDKSVLSSQNYETKSLYTHDTRPEALHVEGLLSIERERVNLLGESVIERINWGEALAPINVKYIILAKENDWKSYKFLDRSKDLEKISEDDNLILYKNNRWFLTSDKETEPLEKYTQEDIKNLEN